MIDEMTRLRIAASLEVLVVGEVFDYQEGEALVSQPSYQCSSRPVEEAGSTPFHSAVIAPDIVDMHDFVAQLRAGVDSTFAGCAALLARGRFAQVRRNDILQAAVSIKALDEIKNQAAQLGRASNPSESPSLRDMAGAILRERGTDGVTPLSLKSDLFVQSDEAGSLFFRFASPCPDEQECLNLTRWVLGVHLVCSLAHPPVHAYIVLPYNPFGARRADYEWLPARRHLPFDEAVLIGAEFWDMIGGPGAYEDLLSIYQEVGHDRSKYIIDALVFGFS